MRVVVCITIEHSHIRTRKHCLRPTVNLLGPNYGSKVASSRWFYSNNIRQKWKWVTQIFMLSWWVPRDKKVLTRLTIACSSEVTSTIDETNVSLANSGQSRNDLCWWIFLSRTSILTYLRWIPGQFPIPLRYLLIHLCTTTCACTSHVKVHVFTTDGTTGIFAKQLASCAKCHGGFTPRTDWISVWLTGMFVNCNYDTIEIIVSGTDK